MEMADEDDARLRRHVRSRNDHAERGDRARVQRVTGRLLEIYLRDHHAAGRAGSALAHRVAANNDLPSARGAELSTVAREVAEDLATLESMMTALGVDPSAVKDSLAVAAERLGRLKLNGSLITRSPLSTVVELEALLAGITAKAAMWRALALLTERGHPLDAEELRLLTERADRQRELVESCRLEACARAFDVPPAPQPHAAAT
jgi:hypothetical protein